MFPISKQTLSLYISLAAIQPVQKVPGFFWCIEDHFVKLKGPVYEFRPCVNHPKIAQDIEEWIGRRFLQSGILETIYNFTKRRPA
jgi:hypothetical protein